MVLCAKDLNAAQETSAGSPRTLKARDAAIELVDKKFNPADAGVVNAPQGKYGESWGLRTYLGPALHAEYPSAVAKVKNEKNEFPLSSMLQIAPGNYVLILSRV